MYSSGTTGRPKGVMLTHANMVAHAVNAHDGWEFEPRRQGMVSMPLFHVGGSSYVLFGIHDGVPAHDPRPRRHLAGRGDPQRRQPHLPRAGGAGPGAAGPARRGATLRRAQDLHLRRRADAAAAAAGRHGGLADTDFIQVYGLTEVSGVVTQLMPDDRTAVAEHPERLVSAGRPIPGVELKIVDPATLEDLPAGEHGEIWVRTPQLIKGYLGKPEETAEVITEDGWFRTGDMGKVDADGFVFVEDRLKDMIISGGENIYPPEVERVLAEHPAVMEVAVIGVPDDTLGRAGEGRRRRSSRTPTATEEELIAFCRDHLAHVQVPEVGRHHRALPRNPTGKILKRDLREAVLGGPGPVDRRSPAAMSCWLPTSKPLGRRFEAQA